MPAERAMTDAAATLREAAGVCDGTIQRFGDEYRADIATRLRALAETLGRVTTPEPGCITWEAWLRDLATWQPRWARSANELADILAALAGGTEAGR